MALFFLSFFVDSTDEACSGKYLEVLKIIKN